MGGVVKAIRLQNRLGVALRRIGAFRAAAGGSVALFTALALPPIVCGAIAAVQLQSVFSAKASLQDAADSAALWGAQQLTISPDGATERTKAWALAQLPHVAANATTLNAAAQVTGWRTMKVTLTANMPSFFMNTFPAGGFNLSAVSTAEGLSQSPLCVLIVGPASTDDISMLNSAKLNGPLCLVHSNQDISVAGTAMLKAATIESSASAVGPITPAASTGAPALEDPFADVNVSFPSPCSGPLPYLTVDGSTPPLAPGVHCAHYEVKNAVTFTLSPGNHYFAGNFILKNGAKIYGDDVALVFAPGIVMDWKNGADINLNGRKSGPLAGFVLIAARENTTQFVLESDHVSNITGTVYVPNATLKVTGTGKAAAASAWTVVAAKAFELSGSPDLVINADYTGTVPVPVGVGNKAGVTHLTQ